MGFVKTSQGGYIAFFATDEIFQGESHFHIIDWRSFKLPRVARSSLSAEAQACGQSSDMAEYVARFWSCMLRPTQNLRDHLDETSTLQPCLITDAKALYDSYHKESLAGASTVDKRTGLEIRVAKEQLTSLGGMLRWVSSERQYADGLTKMSTRALLAERIRYHKMKLMWDPEYTSAKKKTAAEREASRTEFAEPKKKKKESHTTSPTFSSSPQHATPEPPHHSNMFEECDVFEDERPFDERYAMEEPYEPVEAYAGFVKNAKALVYALTLYATLPAASAMHVPLDHEHGRWGIYFFWIILILLLLGLAFALGRRRGIRLQRARQAEDVSIALNRLDSLQLRNDRHDVETQRMREEINMLREVRHTLELERRSANVMAIMMVYNGHQIRHMVGRISRLQGLIANHQMPCPLGDTILVQENLDGAQWHTDADCPILQMNRTTIYELDHCQHCAPRDLRMVQDRAFTGR